jgi:hypothetical protein
VSEALTYQILMRKESCCKKKDEGHVKTKSRRKMMMIKDRSSFNMNRREDELFT